MSKEAIGEAVRGLAAKVGIRIVGRGYLTRGDGTGTLIADQTTRLGYYWQQDDSGQRVVGIATVDMSIVFENNVSYETMAVDLGYKQNDDRLYILGQNAYGMTSGGGISIVEQKFAQTAVASKMPLAVTANPSQPSLTVFVNSWAANPNGTAITTLPVSGTDLTSFVPGSAGLMRYATILVKSDYQTLEVKTSTARSQGGLPLSDADVNESLAAASAGDVAVMAIPLTTGLSTIDQNYINSYGKPLQPYVSIPSSGGTAGTGLTNIGLIMPGSIFNVSPGSLTSNGTFTVTFGTQAPNVVFSGGTAGSAIPTFRPLIVADLPTVNGAPGTYTNSTVIVDPQGLVTSASSGAAPVLSVSGSSPITSSGGTAPVISLSGTVNLAHGGTGADLSATGPGVFVQASSGANATVGQAKRDYLTSGILLVDASDLGLGLSINIASPGFTSLDGVSLTSGVSTILLTGQALTKNNGPFTFNGASSALTRPAWFASGSTTQCFYGLLCRVRAGTLNGGVTLYQSTSSAITIDTSGQSWTPINTNMFYANAKVPSTNGGTGQDFSAGTGILEYSSGLAFLAAAPTGAIVGDSDTQTLTNKSISGSQINSGTVAAARLGTMTGDSGSGGASGAVPAPAAGDATKLFTGAGTYTSKYLRPLFQDVADVNSSGTTENDIYTHTLAAGQLANDGDHIVVETLLQIENSSGNKTIRLYFGGTAYETISVGSVFVINTMITARSIIYRDSSTSVRIKVSVNFNSSGAVTTNYKDDYQTITGLTLSNTQIVKITGQCSVNVSNSITGRTNEVSYMAAA